MPYFDDADISRRHKERIRRMQEDKAKGLTMAQRLTMRSLMRTFKVEIPPTESEGEPFILTFYVPTGDEMERIHALILSAVKISTLDPDTAAQKMKEINEGICTMLEDLSVDESLNKAFWLDPGNSGADESLAPQVIKEMITVLNKMRDDGGSFRKVKDRSGMD